MANTVGNLVSLNDEYLYSYVNGSMYAPLRVDEDTLDKIERAIKNTSPTPDSCIKSITPVWDGGRFMLRTEFNATTKCTKALSSIPSFRTKTEMCFKHLCNGKCTDEFMNNVIGKTLFTNKHIKQK